MDYNSMEHFAQHMGEAVEAVQNGANPSEAMYGAIREYTAEGGNFGGGSQPAEGNKSRGASAPNYKIAAIIAAVLAAIGGLGVLSSIVIWLVAYVF